jgi:hypothetical protein
LERKKGGWKVLTIVTHNLPFPVEEKFVPRKLRIKPFSKKEKKAKTFLRINSVNEKKKLGLQYASDTLFHVAVLGGGAKIISRGKKYRENLWNFSLPTPFIPTFKDSHKEK